MNMVFNTTFRGFYHFHGHENVLPDGITNLALCGRQNAAPTSVYPG